MKVPELIKGGMHQDDRGKLTYNNAFSASEVKRFYTIANKDMNFRRVIDGVPVVPQRNRTGGVDFYQIDNNGNRIGRPIDASGIISAEHNAISQYFRQFTNK